MGVRPIRNYARFSLRPRPPARLIGRHINEGGDKALAYKVGKAVPPEPATQNLAARQDDPAIATGENDKNPLRLNIRCCDDNSNGDSAARLHGDDLLSLTEQAYEHRLSEARNGNANQDCRQHNLDHLENNPLRAHRYACVLCA